MESSSVAPLICMVVLLALGPYGEADLVARFAQFAFVTRSSYHTQCTTRTSLQSGGRLARP